MKQRRGGWQRGRGKDGDERDKETKKERKKETRKKTKKERN